MRLTKDQREIAELVLVGASNHDISIRLNKSELDVHRELRELYETAGVTTAIGPYSRVLLALSLYKRRVEFGISNAGVL